MRNYNVPSILRKIEKEREGFLYSEEPTSSTMAPVSWRAMLGLADSSFSLTDPKEGVRGTAAEERAGFWSCLLTKEAYTPPAFQTLYIIQSSHS